MIRLLLFDYDGVLFDTKQIAYNLVKKSCEKFCKFKIRNEHEFIELYKSNFYEAVRKKGATKASIEKIKKYAITVLKKKKLHIHSGIKSIIKKLSATHEIAVISSNYDDVMKRNLKQNRILGNFHYIYGTEEGESKKIKIKQIMKKAKAKKAEAVFITDTVGDIREAKKAGIKTMAVTWGFHNKKMLKKARPDYLVDSPKEILEVLA